MLRSVQIFLSESNFTLNLLKLTAIYFTYLFLFIVSTWNLNFQNFRN